MAADYFAGGATFFDAIPKMVLSDSTSFFELSAKFEKPCSKITMKQNVEATKSATQEMERIVAIGL